MSALPTSTTTPTILLVDDDAPTRYGLRRLLRQLPTSCQVLEAEDGEQALTLVRAFCHTTATPRSLLVLLDLNMPVMDGLEFLEHQLELSPTCQQVMAVIVVSATPSAAERQQAQALAVEVRPKPLTSEGLAELLRHYLPAALPA